MNSTTDRAAPPPDFKEDERWKTYALGLDELDLRDVMKRLNLSRPQSYGVTGGLRYIDFAECQMVALHEDDLKAIFKARADRFEAEAKASIQIPDCVLCGADIASMKDAHSAEPLAEGWCCTQCNAAKVIPARTKQARQQTIRED